MHNLDLLRQALRELDEKELKSLIKHGEVIEYQPNQIIIEQGTKENCLFIILFGKAKVKKIGINNKELFISELKAGDLIGEIALLLEEPRTASVVSSDKTTLFKISKENYEIHSKKYIGLSKHVTKIIARKLVNATDISTGLHFDDISERLLKFLKNNSEKLSDGSFIIRDMPTQQELAKQINSSRETVSRTLNLLEECNLIERWDRNTCLIK